MASEPQARFLRYYQDQAVQSIIESVDNGKLSPLVVLPTSMGKTYLAIEAYRRLKDLGKVTKKLLWVVQSRELLEQTERSFKSAFPDLKIGYEQGSNKSSLDDDIIISMIQTLKNDRMENLLYSKEGRVGMLVVDEAHHAAAPTYRDLISTFQNYRKKFLRVFRILKSLFIKKCDLRLLKRKNTRKILLFLILIIYR